PTHSRRDAADRQRGGALSAAGKPLGGSVAGKQAQRIFLGALPSFSSCACTGPPNCCYHARRSAGSRIEAVRKRSFNADPPDVAGGPAGEIGRAPGQRSPPLIGGGGGSPGCGDAPPALLAAVPPPPGKAVARGWQQRDDGAG